MRKRVERGLGKDREKKDGRERGEGKKRGKEKEEGEEDRVIEGRLKKRRRGRIVRKKGEDEIITEDGERRE